MPRLHRLLAAPLLAALFVPLLAATPASAASPPPEIASLAPWLAGQLDASGHLLQTTYDNDSYPDYGLTADAVLGLAATGEGKNTADAATTQLEDHVADYTDEPTADGTTEGAYAGATAKLLLVAEVQGVDPTNFGNRNLVTQLQRLEVTSGSAKGRFSDNSQYGDYSNALVQSLGVIALHRHGDDVTAAAGYLALQQCPAGGVRLTEGDTACTDDTTADPDVTGVALQAFVAAGDAAAATKAANWLIAQQAPDGSFKGADVTATPNANSTGIIAAGLAAHGDSAALAKAQGYLRTLQLGCAAKPGDQGAIAYDPAGRDAAVTGGITSQTLDQFRRATTQAVLGLAGVSYVTLDASTSTPTAPTAACTMPFAPVVTNAYQGVLQRAPDSGGLAYWDGRLEAGMSPLTLIAALAGSPEGAQQVVTLEYELLLNRDPDAGGLAYWAGVFQQSQRADLLAAQLVASPERFSADGGQNWQWVEKSLYEAILGRSPDAVGFLYWTNQANQVGPTGRATLVPPFLNTDEAAGVIVTALFRKTCNATPTAGQVASLVPGLRATYLNPVLTRAAIVFSGC